MNVATVELFYGILALAAWVAIAVIGGVRLSGLLSARARSVADDLRAALAPHVLWMAWIVAVAATTGSLYFSEVAGFEPCLLCWYQRIAMYPLVLILGLAAWLRDRGAWVYAAALAGTGAVISAYHVLLEWFPSLSSGSCDPDNPCTLVWFRVFGVFSLPTLALTAFLLILTLVTIRPPRSDP